MFHQLLPFLLSGAVIPVVSVLACGDRRDAAVTGVDGPGVWVISEGDACGPQLVHQARYLTRGGDLHDAAGQSLIVAAEEDGQGGQVRQDLVLTDMDVLRGGRRCCDRGSTGRRGWLAWNARSYSPITIASHPRPGSASAATSTVACGRRAQGNVRLSPASKNSATIVPCPATSIAACCSCRIRDVSGSCQSSVDTRP
jgi:hypothetical protein